MSVLVSKFGGSSMADANGFRRVRALISGGRGLSCSPRPAAATAWTTR